MVKHLAAWCVVLGIGSAAIGADIPRPEHPDPMAVRPHWANLNGSWQFRLDPNDEGLKAEWFKPETEGFDLTITVPFGWESELSGLARKDYKGVAWYRRTFEVPTDFPKGQHVWLRFDAVDYQADVWVNGQKVASHEGGYSPFAADVTEALKDDGKNTVVVRVFDPTDPHLPTGKQIGWYTPTSGIWQTVWIEARPKAYIKSFTIKTNVDPAEAIVTAQLEGAGPDALTIRAEDATVSKPEIAKDANGGSTYRLKVEQPKLWTPKSPHLYDITLELKGDDDQTDTVKTYFGLRTISHGKYGNEPFERILLNGKPIYLRGALDQSFNPKGVYTAPSDEFLKRDIELARSFNLNFLRIHIKPDEPRRLYWADKLGMMIMEDMPNTWAQNDIARKSWEHTMREVIARDINHPAIFCWVAFNETWGLGRPPEYKASKDTQEWVSQMVSTIRKLDPTRLVEDNSPCNYDHVENTDLNSWHFYIDDDARAREHITEVVAKTEPGSAFNYCPGQKQSTLPLINSEYGSVSAGGGDRDVSWGFRDLTTLLRKQPKIQGYIYTELSDIEWEHNGFVNYDRSPKQFGYDAFVPNMTVADLQGADFIGYDGPPAIVAKPNEVIRVPLFVSHYSNRTEEPKLKWWVSGYDGLGQEVRIEGKDRPVTWTQYGVTEQKPVGFKISPGPFVGALGLSLEDSSGHRIAANFVNVVIKPEKPQARVEWRGPHQVALRFAPGDFARQHWSGGVGTPQGKVYGRGKGYFEYRLKLPELVAKGVPETIELLLEVSSKAARERVDWPERVNPQDNPQTDARRWPSVLEITINGQSFGKVNLDDDAADARGVLSHLLRFEHGSYGEMIQLQAELPVEMRQALADGKPLVLRLSVPEDAEHPGGLCVFGSDTGRYPFDPTLTIKTAKALPENLGAQRDAPVAVDTATSRQTTLLAAGDSKAPTTWQFTTSDPGPDWSRPDFEPSGWNEGKPGFGTAGTPAIQVASRWDTNRIWLRTTIDVPALGPDDLLTLHLFHDEDVTIFVNGKRLFGARGYTTSYGDIPLSAEQKALFPPGKNVIAVSCRQTGGGQGVDVGLKLLKGD